MAAAKLDPGYLVGGIPENLGQAARFRASKYFVIGAFSRDRAAPGSARGIASGEVIDDKTGSAGE